MPASLRAPRKPAPRHQARGIRTRDAILRRAVNIASVEGLEASPSAVSPKNSA